MLSKLDDYPIHQTSHPVAQTHTSDRYAYDRYWYNGHAKDGEYYFGIGLCRYPNLGILDCGFSLVIDGVQHAFHGSRRAPDEPSCLEIGPYEMHILEPMGRHRLVIGPNDTGIECDLTFTPRTACMQEGHQSLRNARHVVMEATRLDQFGYWHGTIRYDGKELAVDQRTTYGLKDRSWGIRPVGEPYTGGAPIDEYQAVHFVWAPIHWENQCTLAGLFEDGAGYQWHTDQGILPAYSDRANIPATIDPSARHWQGIVNHQINCHTGTRQAKSATITMNDRSGETMEISLEPLLLYRMKGIGYQHPQWGHGKWQGELAYSGEQWKVDDVDPLALENIHIQQVVRARCGNEVGVGVLEQLHIGPHATIGFNDWFDGA